jgi:glycosyltransferase involved in cell wall biosynthesis
MAPASPTVSFCLIAKNEADQLRRCLDSVRPLCDDLLVVDTGSTDGTVKGALELGASVAFFDWCDDFAAARNYGLAQLTGDWVLMLDADEWLLAEAIAPIRQAIAQEDALVVNLVRHEIGAAQAPYSLVSRLFRRHPALRFDRPYHALIDDSAAALMAADPHWRVLALDGPAIAHDGYRLAAIAGKNKAQRARAAMEKYYAAHPDDPYVCNKLGALLLDLGDGDRGLDLLKTGARIAEREHLTELRFELHYHLAIAHSALGNLDLARSHYRVALRQPVLPLLAVGARVNLGNLYQATGDYKSAAEQYAAAVAAAPHFAPARHNLGLAKKGLGDLNGAIADYRKAIALDGDRPEYHQNLGVALLKSGHTPAALDAFRRAIDLHHRLGHLAEGHHLQETLASMGFVLIPSAPPPADATP